MKNLACKTNDRQQGAAFITVMLLFVIVSVIAYGILERLKQSAIRTTSLSEQLQAYHYALGAEELARQIIAEDALSNPGIVYPNQRWGQLRDGLPIEGGKVSVQIEDLQGRFNLNTLLVPNTHATESFQRLLTSLDIKANSNSIISALSQISTATGEASAPLVDNISALRVGGVLRDYEIARLVPYVSAYPDNNHSLNVNTASPTLIKACIINESTYNHLIDLKTKQGFVTSKEIPMTPGAGGLIASSDYFKVTSKVTFNSTKLRLYSIIHKQSSSSGALSLKIISREIGSF